MKSRHIAVLAAAALVASASYASAANCSRPTKIAVPDGATASEEQMKAAQGKVASYITGMNTYIHCVADDLKGATDEARSVSDDWKHQSDVFVKTPAKAPAQ